MPAKKAHLPLDKYMTPAKGGYKYQRRVPVDVQALAGCKVWDLYLGSNLEHAKDRLRTTVAAHDRLIAFARDPDAVREAAQRGLAEHYAEAQSADPDLLQTSWRETEDFLKHATSLTPAREREVLAIFAWQAFGDSTKLDEIDPPSPMVEAARQFPVGPTPAEGTTEHLMFRAMQNALDERLTELGQSRRVNSEYLLSSLLERYLDLHGVAKQTRRAYTGKIERVINCLGDLPLDEYTPDLLRQYRDTLSAEGLTPESVRQYFAPLKSLMRWVLQEELVPDFDTLPTDKVKMPRGIKSIEERRWQRFDDDEIKTVWAILQEAWGPESRLSADRQAGFRMAFRVLLYTALRPVEVFKLQAADVTPDLILIKNTKTRIARNLPLSKHIGDLYPFMQAGGFAPLGKPTSLAQKMGDTFTKAIRAQGFSNDRHVLYSAKDTLVDRLQRAQLSDDVIRGITGHVSGQGHLRSYKTRLNDTPEGLAILREALDSITYW